MRDLNKLLWGDLQTDRERLEFIESGRAVDTGILAQAMVEDLLEVYRRIDAAVKALQGMTRHEIEPDDQFGIVDERNEHGEWVKWVDVEDVVLFLTANAPTNLESSEGYKMNNTDAKVAQNLLDEARQLCRESLGFLEGIESRVLPDAVLYDNIAFRAKCIRIRLLKIVGDER